MKQKFNFKTLPMLVAALTLCDHFDAEKQVFATENPDWDDLFITNFRNAIQLIMTEYYGVSTKEELGVQTQLVNELAGKAVDDLGMVKAQIERGFRTDPGKSQVILKKLGFAAYWANASKMNQSELIGLLLTFRNNLTEDMRAELEQKGANALRMTNILMYADSLNQANIVQESLKGSTKLDTEKVVLALNDIYDQAMDICRIGQQLFKHDKLKKDLFVFTRLVKKQGGSVTGSAENTPAETGNE